MSVDCFKVAVGRLPHTYKLSQHNSFHVSLHGLLEQLPCSHSIFDVSFALRKLQQRSFGRLHSPTYCLNQRDSREWAA